MMSPEEIERNSVVEITSRETYNNNKPVIGGLFDPRMGVLEKGFICPTDGLNYIHTPGYFGHMKMARPVFFIQHLKQIIGISKCVCFKCSRLLIDKEANAHLLELDLKQRWEAVLEKCANVRRCGDSNLDGCGTRQPTKIKHEGMATLTAIWELVEMDNVSVRLTPELLLRNFKRITDEDVSFMGFSPLWSRPEWMICTILPVPPPAVRPSVKHDAQQRSEDDLTQIYSNILKVNKELAAKIQDNAQTTVIENITNILQYFVAMIVNNKTKGSLPLQQRSGRPYQCIMTRINSKTGRIRGNLMGKRVNYSARSVITGDPNLTIQQLGVPMKIAKNITKPVVVNQRNMNALLRLIRNGPDVFPGAKTIQRKNGLLISLRTSDRESIQLFPGDIVNRHMMDGDAVLFNRQPSLHRMSMMCHIVKVMEQGDTFRFNVSCTKPYNADFDGDEMNMHMPQNIMAETELKNIAAIPFQIVSPANNAPIIGIFQDSLLGSFRMTRESIRFDPKKAMNLLMAFPHVDLARLQQDMFGSTNGKPGSITNFQILSQILPPMSMLLKNKQYNDDADTYADSNNVVEIRNGEMLRGRMDATIKTIIHRIYNDYGYMEATRFIDNWQNIITEYMKTSAFSVGISDLLADVQTKEKIQEIMIRQKSKVRQVMDQVHLGIFENNTSYSNVERFEIEVRNLLNAVGDETGKLVRDKMKGDNRFVTIINSGSKGSPLNLSQMITCVGQTNVEGKRVPYGFDNRTLPHYTKYDDSPNARGFIENSYISGLTAEELFFHAMGGRIGLIDTAVKSVVWDTPIVIIEEGKPMYTEIGRWIDGQLDTPDANVQHYPNDRNLELMNLEEGKVYIPTTCEDGHVSWEAVSAITRHDPGTVVYQFKTQSGREVIASESKSMLVWDDEKQGFFEKDSTEIKVGHAVPTTLNLPEPPDSAHKGFWPTQIVCENGSYPLTEASAKVMGSYLRSKGIVQFPLLDEITGNGNHLPPEVFVAPEPFIQALLQACLSYEPFHEPIMTKRLAEDINFLLARCCLFASLVELDDKSGFIHAIQPRDKTAFYELLQTKPYSVLPHDFEVHNDVIMDPIVEINILPVDAYPKLYDLTIPTTLNFALANGLQVRDTSQTGYIQRRLIKGLEDLKVEYDMTVRNNKRKIIQFQYGEDGFDPTKVENQPVKLVGMSLDQIYLLYDFTGLQTRSSNDTNLSYIYNTAAKSRFGKQKDELRTYCAKYTDLMVKRRKEIVHHVFKDKTDDTVRLPVAFHSILTNMQGQLNLSAQSLVDITPVEVFQLAEETMAKIRSFRYVPVFDLFETLFYFYLNPKDLIEKKRFHETAIKLLLETILIRFKQALVAPGEMVGVVAGQSIGEPTTQLTLNTFHTAGSAKSNATRGVPRIEEILRLTKFPKTPSLTVYLNGQDRFSKEKANAYSKILRYTKLVHVVRSVEIVFDPVEKRTQLPQDQLLMNQFLEFESIVEASQTNSTVPDEQSVQRSKWIVRMEIDAETLFENNITMDDIDYAIQNSHLGPYVQCIYSDFNSDNLVFRIAVDQAALSKKKVVKALDFNDDIYTLKVFQETLLNTIVLRGIPNIKNVLLREIRNTAVEEDGQFKKKDMWILDTTGSNLLEVLALDYIDPRKTSTNNIAEIHDVLGIEATRQSILNEMEEVMESSGSIYINYHHLSLLCDRMTANKDLVAIFRTGILNDDIGPIAKATFEVQTDEFLKAARHGELDTMRGVSANVMCGQTGYYGTHAFNVLLDMPKYRQLPAIPEEQKRQTAMEALQERGASANQCLDIGEFDNGIDQQGNAPTDPCASSNMLDDDYDMGF
jgi:DNA-directed RNA polymerase beta' subunit